MMADKTYARLMEKARKTNAERDRVDRAGGFGTPGSHGPDELLRTAMTAISAGIRACDDAPLAEGLAMLEQLHRALHPTGAAFTV